VCAVDFYRIGTTMAACSPFTDSQLRTVWAAADRIPVEKRGVFLERVVARLQLRGDFTDSDLDNAVRAALTGLIQSALMAHRRFSAPCSVEELEFWSCPESEFPLNVGDHEHSARGHVPGHGGGHIGWLY
jgi:hypothetical protein